MSSTIHMACWEIMSCDRKDTCPAWLQAPTPCWEIALTLNDYRSALNVCSDCIVYVLNNNAAVFSAQELEHIKARRTACVIRPQDCNMVAVG